MATNFEFIKSASGSSVGSLSLTNCFSEVYDVYKITFDITNSSESSAIDFFIRLIDSAGNVISASEYDRANFNLNSNSSFGSFHTTNSDKFNSHTQLSSASNSAGGLSYIINPFDAENYTFHMAQTFFENTDHIVPKKIIGVHKVEEQITGFSYIIGTGTFTGSINVYGMR